MQIAIIKSILGVLRLIAPVTGPLIDDIEHDIDAGKVTFDDIEQLVQHALSVGENYWSKGADVLADVANIIPQVYKLVTDCQKLSAPPPEPAAAA